MVTMRDIAKEAGVTHSVVSAVVNNRENSRIFVSKKTKEKILQLVDQYGYVPRKTALAFASGKTNNIGIIVHQLTPYFSRLLEALSEEASAFGFEILPYILGDNEEKEEECFNLMRDGRVDGIIATAFTVNSDCRYRKYSSEPYNLKIVTISPPVENVPSVYLDEKRAGELAAEHLVSIGCRRLCIFGGTPETLRMKGFVEYVRKKGLPEPITETSAGFMDLAKGEFFARKLLTSRNRPDGVFAYNDLVGVSLIKECIRTGVKVPDEIAIVGCDNTEVCLHTYPQLTSIDTNLFLASRLSFAKLMDVLDEKEGIELHTKIQVSLVVRESTIKEEKL